MEPKFAPFDLTEFLESGNLLAVNENILWPVGLALTVDAARQLLDCVEAEGAVTEEEISAALFIAYLEFSAESYWDLAEGVRRVHDCLFRYGISR
jgi:hypothetical protein